MGRIGITLICIIFSFPVLSQEIVAKKILPPARLWRTEAETLPVTDTVSGITTIFVVDKPEIAAFVIGKDSIIDEFAGIRPARNASNLLGYSVSSGKYHLYFSNKSYDAFSISTIDFAKRQFYATNSDLRIKRETFVGSASFKNRFYFLTVTKESSRLNLYKFEDGAGLLVKSFSFEGTRFVHGITQSLEQAIIEGNEAAYMDNRFPNSIGAASSKNKIFCSGETMMLTFDNIPQYTVIIIIDLNSYKEDLLLYSQNNIACDPTMVEGSSYIHNNLLYQFSICSSEMALSIRDLRSGRVLKKYGASSDQEISFRNTEIRQQGSWLPIGPGEKELSKTRQFFRRASGAFPGVSVFKNEIDLEVTLGGYAPIATTSGGSIVPLVSSPVGPANMGNVVNMPSYNPAYSSFVGSQNGISVTFTSVLDSETLEHKAGATVENPFRKMEKFMNESNGSFDKANPIAQTIFRIGKVFYLTYYDRGSGEILVRAFY